MDLDGNGTIDFDEFTHGLKEMDMDLGEEKTRSLFRYFDKVISIRFYRLFYFSFCFNFL